MTARIAAVTGATGCLGRALVRHLVNEGVEVRAISRSSSSGFPRVTGITADVRDVAALTRAFEGVEVVFHLAAHVHDVVSSDDSALQQATTFGGTTCALTAAERAGVEHFVFASSLAVHGPSGDDQPSENSPCTPVTPYGRAKLDAERAVSEFAARTGVFASSIRPAMIYGVGNRGNLSRMIRAIRSGFFPPIPEFGNRRSLVADTDAARAMVSAWRAGIRGGRAFIVTDGLAYSTRQMYQLILAAMGRHAPRFEMPRAVFLAAARVGDVGARAFGKRLPFDSSSLDRLTGSAYFVSVRAGPELGFAPTTTLSDALPAMIRHIADQT